MSKSSLILLLTIIAFSALNIGGSVLDAGATGVGLAVAATGDDCCLKSDCGSDECWCAASGANCQLTPTKKGTGVCQPSGNIVLCPPTKYHKIEDLAESISDWLFYIGLILVPLMFVIAGFMYATAAGNGERVKTANTIILWTIVGLIVMLFSKVFISVIRFVLGQP